MNSVRGEEGNGQSLFVQLSTLAIIVKSTTKLLDLSKSVKYEFRFENGSAGTLNV